MIKNGGIAQEYQLGYAAAAYSGVTQNCSKPSGNPVASITGFTVLPTNNYTALLNAIATVGPIAIAVDASWGAYKSGIYNKPLPTSPDIDHEVVLVGYGEENGQKYWIVRNSWSPTWLVCRACCLLVSY